MRLLSIAPLALLVAARAVLYPAPLAQEHAPAGSAVAVIVNQANTTADPSFYDLQAILKLQTQFWRDGKRVVLLLPPSGSAAKDLLLEKVYHRTDSQLRMEWARRLFAGEIPAVPTTLRSVEALVAAVGRSAGAIAVVPAGTSVPENVRILSVAGKRPGDHGYALSDGF